MAETRLQEMLRLNAELTIREELYQIALKAFDKMTADLRHERAAIEEDKARLAYVARSADAAGEIRLRYAITETT